MSLMGLSLSLIHILVHIILGTGVDHHQFARLYDLVVQMIVQSLTMLGKDRRERPDFIQEIPLPYNRQSRYDLSLIHICGPSPRDTKREEIVALVKQVHAAHPTHGYRWTAAYLRINMQVIISDNYAYKMCIRDRSTLIRLMLGLLKPDSGTVTVYDAGSSCAAGKPARGNFRYVPQGNSCLLYTSQDACEQGSHQHGDLTHVTQSGHDLRSLVTE